MEARIPIKLRSYRAFKHPWVGSPRKLPDIHTETVFVEDGIITIIHVSWNGDTRTVEWEFTEIDKDGNVQQLGSIKRQGFETRFEYQAFAGRVFAEAFDANGISLVKSEVATTTRPSPLREGDSLAVDIPEAEQDPTSLP